jgi:PilZ domain-containing protein
MPEGSLNRAGVTRQSSSDLPPAPAGAERGAYWVAAPFPALIRGVDASGDRFQVAALLDTLSTEGLYVRLGRPVEPGAILFVVVRLSTAPDLATPAPRIAAHGRVVRVERQAGGMFGVGVAFVRHRFLYASLP